MTDLLPVMDPTEARRLTERIRLTATTFAESRDKLIDLVGQAKAGNAHIALGYDSWTAYLADVLGDEPLRLARDDRRELVAALTAEGMSTRAIAPIVGVGKSTVDRDIDAPVPSGTPVPRPAITGRDGKSYTPPPPKPPANVDPDTGEIAPAPTRDRAPSRKPLTDAFNDAAYDLLKAAERIERLTTDDRWSQNAEKVAARNRSDLVRAMDALQSVLNRLTPA